MYRDEGEGEQGVINLGTTHVEARVWDSTGTCEDREKSTVKQGDLTRDGRAADSRKLRKTCKFSFYPKSNKKLIKMYQVGDTIIFLFEKNVTGLQRKNCHMTSGETS